MASEIRVNSISSRSGLSTITFGAYGVEIAGITTISQLNVNSGTNANFSGVVTATGGFVVGTGASVYSPATNVLALGTNNAERVRINSSGNVGIGTDNPTTEFHVQDGSDLLVALFESPNNHVRLRIKSASSSLGQLEFADADDADAGEIRYAHSTDKMTFHVGNNTERVGITSGGNVQIANGNLVFSTSGTGIDFSAASGSAAGSTSALLDDYEEGTFTPSFTGSTTNPTITYLNQLGRYTKIGNVCFIEIRMVTSNVSGGGGNLKISGLPFSQSPNSNLGGAFTKGFVFQWAQDPETFITFSGDSTIGIYRNDSTNTIAQVSDLTSGAVNNYLNISGSYITA